MRKTCQLLKTKCLRNCQLVKRDALKKLGKIAADQAATALTEFLEKSIFMKVTSFELVRIESFPNLLQN